MTEESGKKRRSKGKGRLSQENKRRRAEGKQYTTAKSKIVVEKLIPERNVACKYLKKSKQHKCAEILFEHRLKLFNEFYALQDNVKQSSYIMGLMHIVRIKRRRHGQYETPSQSRRQTSVTYTIPDGNGNVVQVCRATFANTFGLTQKKIQVLTEKKNLGESIYTEKRGNKKKYRKFTVDHEEMVIAHVNSIPRDKSHYTRQKSDKEYLSPELNINRLYKSFKIKYPDTTINYRFYSRVFKKSFPKLSFHSPRVDTCGTCDILHAQIKTDPTNRAKLELHHRKAEKARQHMKQDTEQSQLPNSNHTMAAMDLEQVLFLPTLTHSQMFYVRQLSNYNLCIHIGDDNTAYMNIWHEGIAGRGGNEIASCVLKIFLERQSLKKKLIMWSDNCCGQNKNRMMIFIWIYLICKGKFEEVNQKFLVSGHSFLSCDRDFAKIEVRKKVEKCMVPEDLKKMIEGANDIHPFKVNMLEENEFFDVKSAADSTLNTSKLNISKVSWIKIEKNNPGIIKVKESFSDLQDWKNIKVFKKNVTTETIRKMTLRNLPIVNHISDEKKNNLRDMIPFLEKEEHKEFFRKLVA